LSVPGFVLAEGNGMKQYKFLPGLLRPLRYVKQVDYAMERTQNFAEEKKTS
jgi:hypothetical protein